MIFRTAIEEIIVRTDQDKTNLELVIHWKGGAHTQLTMERPRSATETAAPMEALEIIRLMAARYGDDQIASVLNRRAIPRAKGSGGIIGSCERHAIPSVRNRFEKPGDLLRAQHHRKRFGPARIGDTLGHVLACQGDAEEKTQRRHPWLSVAHATPRDTK
jgi:hypothetical protein